MRIKSVSQQEAGPSRLFYGLDEIRDSSDCGSRFGQHHS